MELKPGVELFGLNILMRPVLKIVEDIYHESGRPNGSFITCTTGGIHLPHSFHAFGLAIDYRNRFFPEPVKDAVYVKMRGRLERKGYQVIRHDTHFHVEPNDRLLARHSLLINWK